MSADSWLVPLGGLLELEDDSRVVVVRPDGSLFASMPLRGRTISSGLVPDRRATAVAFTSAGRQSEGMGAETTYLLRAGSGAAVAVHTERVSFRGCERGADLQWHGGWLLYDASEGNVAVIDTSETDRTIDLTTDVKRLPGTRGGFDASWSPQPAEGV